MGAPPSSSPFFATGVLGGQLVTPPLTGVNGLATILRDQPLVGLALIGVLYLAAAAGLATLARGTLRRQPV